MTAWIPPHWSESSKRTLSQLGSRRKKVTIWVHVDRYGRTHHPFMRQVEKLDYEVDLIKAAKHWRFEPATIDGRPVKYCIRVTCELKFDTTGKTPEAAPRVPITHIKPQDYWGQPTWEERFLPDP